MRKLKLFLAMLMLIAFSVGNVWAAVESGTTYAVKAAASFPTDWTYVGGFSTGGGGYIQLTANSSYIQTDAFCQNGFTSVVVKARKVGGPDATQGVISVDWWEEGATEPVTLGTVSPSGTGLADLTISSPADVTGNKNGYIKISCKGASSSKGCGVSEVTITYTAGSCTAADPYTVSFSTGAGNPDVSPITEAIAGAGITLPAGPTPACSADGWSFAGWAAAAVGAETTTAPTLLSGTYHPTENCTLFAVYKRTEAGGGSTTKSMTSFEAISGNVENDVNVSYAAAQGTASTAPAINSGEIRIYQNGGLLTITANNGSKLNNITIGSSMTTKVTYAVDGGSASGNNDIAKNGTFTVDELDATEVVFTCTGTDKNSRLYLNNLSVTYSGGGTTYYLSAPTCAAPTCENLGTPSVTVTNKTYNSAKLTWAAVDNADKYLVKFNGVDQEATENLYFDATGLEAEETYTYQVKALAEEGQDDWCDGAFSAEANFTTEPAPAATLTLSENTVTHNLAGDHTLGETVTLPSADDCSKKFRGWSVNENCETEPELHAGDSYTLNATSQTLYAVYAKVMSVSDPSLIKQGTGATFAAGEKLVIVAVVGDDQYALYRETTSSSYVKNWAFDNNVATVAADAKKYVTLEAGATSGKYYMGDATNGYVYSSGSNNLSVDATNKTEWTIVDNEDGTFGFNQGRLLSCRSDLESDKVNLYRLAGSTPGGTYKLDVYKYSAGDATYGEWSTTCTAPLASPTFSVNPADGPFTTAQSVELSATEGTIYYNINSADDPTSASTPYTDAIDVDACGSTTIKAIAISSTNQSLVASATYVLNLPIPENAENNPYSIATAKSVIDGGCYNNEDVYVTGTVASAQLYNSGTYTVTLEDGFQFYYLYKAAGETPFDSGDETIEAGDVLVAFGKLGMHNTTYQLDHGYLVSRTPAPKTPIDSDIDNPISVATAVNYIDNAATYDLSEDEFVAGIVESIAECPQHEGTYDIIILDATDNTKQMKFFGCDVKTFTGIKQYDQITGKGKLFKYYSTYELNYPCEVVALTPYVAPAVSVTGVEVDATASVQVGKTVQLTATVTPDNATNKNVTWSVKAGGEDYAEVSATGLVTGKAEGEAIIVVTTEDGSFTDECTVTINPVPYWATVYTSNVEFTGQNSYESGGSKVVIAEVEYDAQKVGASSNQGQVIVTVPAKTHTLHFHVFTWKNKSNVISISGVTNPSATTFDVIGDNGGGASSPYTIEGNPIDHYYSVTFDAVTDVTDITFDFASGGDKRFIMYGINQEGGAYPVLDHIVITGNASTTEYEAGDVFSLVGLGVDAYYTLDDEPIAEPTHLDIDENWSGWSVSPAILTAETESVTVTATYEGKQANKNVNVTVTAPETPEIIASPAAINFGIVNQNAAVDAQGISVTLKAVVAATVTLDNDAAFTIDKAALTELNSTITVTPKTTATGTFAATITISDDADAADDVVINLSMKVEPNEDLSGTWIKATSVAAGDRIIIGATVSAGTKTMGKQNTNNRAAIASSLDEYGVLTPAEGTKTFLVVDAGDGKFALQALNGNYLTSATSGTGNNLWEAANFENDNAKWTITIDGEGVASVVAAAGSRTYMQYNNGSTLFSCYQYATSQSPINIYKHGTPDYGSYHRNVTEGNYGTICLPKAGVISGAKLFEIAYKGDGVIYCDEILSGEMEAGVPYIFQATANQLNVAYSNGNAPVAASDANGLYGFYNLSNMATDEADKLDLDKDQGNYILYDNQYWLVSGRAAYINNFRAYIKLDEISTSEPTPTPGAAPRRRVAMTVNGAQTATGMDELNASQAPVKVIIDGQLFIIRGEQMFNANGQLVK